MIINEYDEEFDFYNENERTLNNSESDISIENTILWEIDKVQEYLDKNLYFENNNALEEIKGFEEFYEEFIDDYLMKNKSEYVDFDFLKSYVSAVSLECLSQHDGETDDNVLKYLNLIKYFIEEQKMKKEFGDDEDEYEIEDEDDEYESTSSY